MPLTKALDNANVVITLYSYGAVEPVTVVSLCNALDFGKLGNVYLETCLNGSIEYSRSLAASKVLTSSADVWVQIDRDMAFPRETLTILARSVRRTRGVVSTAALNRHTLEPAMRIERDITIGEPKLEPIRHTGLAVSAIHRRALERIAEHATRYHDAKHGDYIGFFAPMDGDPVGDGKTHWMMDDFAFCTRAQMAGVPIHIACNLKIGHVGADVLWPDRERTQL